MASIKERYEKWKSRKLRQKIGDVVFWIFLILLIIPGPRKVITTGINRVFLNLKHPSMTKEDSRIHLEPTDYQWNIADETGAQIDPETFQDEVVFLNFWATWCPPCIAELPEVQKIYDAYGDRVKFVLVTSQSPGEVKQFLSDRDYALPVYYGGQSLPEKLKVSSIPTTYIIAKDGSIVSRKVGAADWDSRATREIFDLLLAE